MNIHISPRTLKTIMGGYTIQTIRFHHLQKINFKSNFVQNKSTSKLYKKTFQIDTLTAEHIGRKPLTRPHSKMTVIK